MAFMGGMALGAFIFGKIINKKNNHLKLYALIELAIGIYALILPLVVSFFDNIYINIYQQYDFGFYAMSLIKLCFSIIILLGRTILMGATLPILVSFVTSKMKNIGKETSVIYSVNTLGGVSGCILAAFLLIPYLGIQNTIYLAVLINIFIFVVSYYLNQISKQKIIIFEKENNVFEEKYYFKDPKIVLYSGIISVAVAGFTAMVYQIIWTRVLTMIVGTTVYAYATILAAFLSGIVLGSYLFKHKAPSKNKLFMLACIQFLIGFTTILFLYNFDKIPFIFLKLFGLTSNNWLLFQILRFFLLFIIMLIPTTLFGYNFPLTVSLVHIINTKKENVGTVYGVNTLGSVVGTFIGGFIFIPFLGFQKGILIAAVLNIFLGIYLLFINPALSFFKKSVYGVLSSIVILVMVSFLQPWNINYLNSGSYIYAHQYNELKNTKQIKRVMNQYEIIYYHEGLEDTVSVFLSENKLSLAINGKTDASTGVNADMSTQILLAHLPVFFIDHPDNTLMIGLGSGISLGSLSRYKKVKNIDVVEISKGVIAASRYFKKYNYNALTKDRVNLIVGDGRHHLKRTAKKYNLIISQPSNPWIKGVANLFTKEYYGLMYQRLKSNGVVCQWIPSYHMSKRMLAIIIKTFRTYFPNVTLWTSSVVGDLFLIASKSALELNYKLFKKRMDREIVLEDLERIDLTNIGVLTETFKYGRRDLDRYLSKFSPDLPMNEDLNPILEYITPKYLLTERISRNLNRRSKLTGDLDHLLNLINFKKTDDKAKK